MDTGGAETAGFGPRCAGCGSQALRPARSRSGWQQWVRSVSSAERYACEACGHRGWRLGKVEERRAPAAPAGASRSPGGHRGRSARRGAGLQSLQAALFALLLGAIAALLILRMGGGPR